MTDVAIKAFQLIASLSILVILHELGHFIPARLFKTRVEKFYLFFDPWFSLFKFKKGDTEYGIGWLPLGGYVKISGMIDESMDKEQMNQPAQPWEFRAKPAWQRLIIMVGGVTVNLILGVMIYAMVLFAYGDKYLPNDELKNGVWCIDSLAQEIGFQNGDKIVAINGKSIEKFNDIMPELLLAGYVDIDRNGEQIKIDVPSDFIERIINNESKQFFYPRVPTIVKAFPDTSAAKLAGLLEKDKIVGINGKEILFFDAFKQELANFKGQEVSVMVERDGERKEFPVVVSDKGSIGIEIGIASLTDMEKMGLYNLKTSEFGFFESIPAGFNKAIEKLTFYVRQFKLILNPSTGAYKGVGGFGSIGGLFPAEWDWESFWEITAFLSLILAFMNILPIPALDGGHVMFLLYEIIFRRKPNEKFMEYAQMAGMILLLGLLIMANGNDIFKLFR